MSHAYVPARVWPYVYVGHSWAAKKRVDPAVAEETTAAKANVETRREVPSGCNLGCNNPQWWVSHHYEQG
jgi:hypothetical protein